MRAAAAKLKNHDRPFIKDFRKAVPSRVERRCFDRAPFRANLKLDLEPLGNMGLGFRQELSKQRAAGSNEDRGKGIVGVRVQRPDQPMK